MIKFGRETTQILKGIALILMIILHTVQSGNWGGVINEDTYRFILKSTKMCVWIFAISWVIKKLLTPIMNKII